MDAKLLQVGFKIPEQESGVRKLPAICPYKVGSKYKMLEQEIGCTEAICPYKVGSKYWNKSVDVTRLLVYRSSPYKLGSKYWNERVNIRRLPVHTSWVQSPPKSTIYTK